MTNQNTSKTRCESPVELQLGPKVRLPAITEFDRREPDFFKSTSRSPTVSDIFIIRNVLTTSFLRPENSNKTVHVSDNKISRLEQFIDEQSTDSQSESSRENIDLASPIFTEETSVTESEEA